MNDSLKSLNIDIIQASNYLISLFYRTEKRYSASRTKIGKLISIVAFVYARWGVKLFQEDIFRYPNCGTIIPKLNGLDRDAYIMFHYFDDKKYINDDFFVDFEIPKFYDNFENVPKDVRFVIEDVFRNFGAYSQKDLGDCLNKIVDIKYFVDPDGVIDLECLKDLETYDFKDKKDLDVINYLIN